MQNCTGIEPVWSDMTIYAKSDHNPATVHVCQCKYGQPLTSAMLKKGGVALNYSIILTYIHNVVNKKIQ